jgi:hypothetical protein
MMSNNQEPSKIEYRDGLIHKFYSITFDANRCLKGGKTMKYIFFSKSKIINELYVFKVT